MAGHKNPKTSNIASPTSLENQQESNNSIFYPNSAYRSAIEKVEVKIPKPVGIVTRYIDAMNAYDDLRSEGNYKILEEVKKEYKDFLDKNIS